MINFIGGFFKTWLNQMRKFIKEFVKTTLNGIGGIVTAFVFFIGYYYMEGFITKAIMLLGLFFIFKTIKTMQPKIVKSPKTIAPIHQKMS